MVNYIAEKLFTTKVKQYLLINEFASACPLQDQGCTHPFAKKGGPLMAKCIGGAINLKTFPWDLLLL